jgi:hypothetical protein
VGTLGTLAIAKLAQDGPMPFGTLAKCLALTQVEIGRLNEAIDAGQVIGVFRYRRNRRPRSIVGIEGDSRTWGG